MVKKLPDIHRLLPQSPDAEKGLLGSALLDPQNVIPEAMTQGILISSFHIPAHQIIWSSMIQMHKANLPIDIITLTQHIMGRGKIGEAGGPALISALMTFVPTAANASYYAEIVLEKHTLRRIIEVGTEYVARAYEEQENVPVLVDELEEKIFKIGTDRYSQNSTKTIRDIVYETMEWVNTMIVKPGSGLLYTGIKALDKITGGFPFGIPVLIKAATSYGKSSLMQCIAIDTMKRGYGVIHYSLELPQNIQALRYISSLGGATCSNMMAGNLTEEELKQFSEGSGILAGSPLHLVAEDMEITQLRSHARKTKAANPNIRLIVVDYAQKVRVAGRMDNREQEVACVSDNCQKMAMELDCVVTIGSQQNEKGQERESRTLGHDARIILEIAKPDGKDDLGNGDFLRTLSVVKNNNGPTGSVDVVFNKPTLTFRNK